MDVYDTRFWIYTVRQDGEPTQEFHQLLSEEGRQILDRALKTPGWWVDVRSPTTDDMKALSKVKKKSLISLFVSFSFIHLRRFISIP